MANNTPPAGQTGAASAVPDADADPSMSGAPDDDQDQDQGYTICIAVAADGSLSVGVLPGDASESGSSAGAGGDDDDSGGDQSDDFAPAKNIKDALTVALDIYRNDGQMGEASDADADMQAGFGGSTAQSGAGA